MVIYAKTKEQLEAEARRLAAERLMGAPAPMANKSPPAPNGGVARPNAVVDPNAGRTLSPQTILNQKIYEQSDIRAKPQRTFTTSQPIDLTPNPRGSYMDPEVEKRLREMLAERDTSAEEALARRTVERAEGQALADSRAKSGFAGFGLSGAAAAGEADIRAKASDALMSQILGIQKTGRDESFRNVGLVSDQFNQDATRNATTDIERDKNKTANDELSISREAWQYLLDHPKLFGLEDGSTATPSALTPAPPLQPNSGGATSNPNIVLPTANAKQDGSEAKPISITSDQAQAQGLMKVQFSNPPMYVDKTGKHYVIK